MLENDLQVFELREKARIVEICMAARTRHRDELRNRSAKNLKRNWPLAAGLVLAFLAPWLQDLASLVAPLGGWILLPAVSLVNDQQLHLNAAIRVVASQFALYGQFPIEAAVIQSVLKGRVSLGAVLGQLALFHFLAAGFLWLLSRCATA